MDDTDIRIPDDAGEYTDALGRILRRFTRGGGIECGPGWYGILADLDTALTDIDPQYSITQIKEKFGTLRYYVSSTGTTAFHQRIREAERLSELTCEQCGAPGLLRDELSWIRTLCDRDYIATVEQRAQEWRKYAATVQTDWPTPILPWAGWNEVIRDMQHDLRRIDPALYAMQISQRAGALTVACWPSQPELAEPVQARINHAITDAARTCQRCSAPGELHEYNTPYSTSHYVLCQACAELVEWERERETLRPPIDTDALRSTTNRQGPIGVPVLIELPDGRLIECGYPEHTTVQVVDHAGERSWTRATTEPVAGDRPLGASVPAVLLSATLHQATDAGGA